MAYQEKLIDPNNIILDPNNPRFNKDPHQKVTEDKFSELSNKTLERMLSEKSFAVHELVESIKVNTFKPVDKIFVKRILNTDEYVVIEGNRRISAIKKTLNDGDVSVDVLKSIEKISCQDLTGQSSDEIEFILGLRHIGSIKAWEPLPAANNIMRRYLQEIYDEGLISSIDIENFVYSAPHARKVSQLYSISLPKAKSRIFTFRLYWQIQQRMKEMGFDEFPNKKFSMIEDTIKKEPLKKYFEFNPDVSMFSEEGLEKWINLCFGDLVNKIDPVIEAAAAGDKSNLRDFSYIVAEGNDNYINRVKEKREPCYTVKADIDTLRNQRELLQSLEFAFSELERIQLGNIDVLDESELELIGDIETKLKQIVNAQIK